MPYTAKRTVKTVYTDGSGSPRVETRTYTFGGPAGSPDDRGQAFSANTNIGFDQLGGPALFGGGVNSNIGFNQRGGPGFFGTGGGSNIGFDQPGGPGFYGRGGTSNIGFDQPGGSGFFGRGGTSNIGFDHPGGTDFLGTGGNINIGFNQPGVPDAKLNVNSSDVWTGGRPSVSPGGGYRSSGFSCPQISRNLFPQPKIRGRPQRRSSQSTFGGLSDLTYPRGRAECQKSRNLFEDPEFPVKEQDLSFIGRDSRRLEWKRPYEICNNPEWISAGASRFDVRQGELGDCWLLAAVASLTCNSKLFNRVVPPDQDFKSDYCGIFRFNFWHQGDWKEVVVDDLLPTYNGQLVFMHSTEKNEFWSALLEKAYAKLMGSYEALVGGSTTEAMEDFTGGVTEMFELRGKQPPNLLKIILKAHERGSLMGCSIDANPNMIEAQLENGLIMGHAYSITSVVLMDIKSARKQGQIPMVRIRNPWGNECEWKGAWSDSSREWSLVSESEKQEMGLKKDDDGEFWMSFQDFIQEFQKLEICNLGPDSLDEENLSNKKRWEVHKEHSAWVKRVSAGGCRNYLDTFWTNPQFRMTLTDVDDDDDDDTCTAIIALMQKDRRKKKREGVELLTLGYVIYKLEEGQSGTLDLNFFKYNASVAKSPTFINMREVCGRHKLPPGTYCIVPSTFEPNFEGEFLIRIFTEKANSSGEMDEETSYTHASPTHPVGPNHHQKESRKPPNEEEKAQANVLKTQFVRIAGEDMEIDAYELQELLNRVFMQEFRFPGFNIEATRSMVAMHDGDMSGKLGFEEFKELWDDLRHWKGVFKQFDQDKSGFLSSYELKTALNHAGFRLSRLTLQSLVMRYSNRKGQIDFGDFITCAVRLKTILSSFSALDPRKPGNPAIDLEAFTRTMVYT